MARERCNRECHVSIIDPLIQKSADHHSPDRVNPLVSYRTYQQLIVVNIDPDIFYPGLAYCPLVLDYDVRERDKTTRNLDTK